MKKTFSWDAGHATCTAFYKNRPFIGEANCHPDDADFESERVGLHIAEMRADILVLQYIRSAELKPAVETLSHIQDSFSRSSQYNAKSYEAKCIRRQLRRLQNELTAVNKELANLKLELTVYIRQKEKFYQSIRKARNKQ